MSQTQKQKHRTENPQLEFRSQMTRLVEQHLQCVVDDGVSYTCARARVRSGTQNLFQ